MPLSPVTQYYKTRRVLRVVCTWVSLEINEGLGGASMSARGRAYRRRTCEICRGCHHRRAININTPFTSRRGSWSWGWTNSSAVWKEMAPDRARAKPFPDRQNRQCFGLERDVASVASTRWWSIDRSSKSGSWSGKHTRRLKYACKSRQRQQQLRIAVTAAGPANHVRRSNSNRQ